MKYVVHGVKLLNRFESISDVLRNSDKMRDTIRDPAQYTGIHGKMSLLAGCKLWHSKHSPLCPCFQPAV
jgi:hypothetical protein